MGLKEQKKNDLLARGIKRMEKRLLELERQNNK